MRKKRKRKKVWQEGYERDESSSRKKKNKVQFDNEDVIGAS
jgi:3'-phosphoadenosine 5'-phosphosulfate sulfotransferase (PAPS reductase)/FAD synthetase